MTSDRRDFLRQLTLATAAVGGGAIVSPLGAEELSRAADRFGAPSSAWDMSWVDQVQRAQYKAVFDSPALADGCRARPCRGDPGQLQGSLRLGRRGSHGDRHAPTRAGNGVQRRPLEPLRDRRGAEGERSAHQTAGASQPVLESCCRASPIGPSRRSSSRFTPVARFSSSATARR